MNTKFDDTIYNLILKHAFLPEEQLDALVKESHKANVSFSSLVLQNANINEQEFMQLLAAELNLTYMSLKRFSLDRSVIDAVPYKFACYYKFVPLKIEKNVLTIAVASPLDIKTQDELRLHFGYEIKMVLASEREVLEVLKKLYGVGADVVEQITAKTSQLKDVPEQVLPEEVEDIERLAEDASIIKLVNQIILEAYRKRATDIHIEPFRGEVKIRYRIDGVLYDANVSPNIKRFLLPVLSRIKIMSNLNIVEHRLPQDGRAIVRTQEQVLDLRVSFMPTPHGESVVIRILPMGMLFGLEKLGLTVDEEKLFQSLINRPNGIIFVTGPTGSGKTTTLYACLSKINTKEKKILTIEDPIEYELSGVIQIQVMPEIDLTFARGLRSMLRHDPDIMMVGEVRDLETAEIAMRAALTGHLVFSTLHTNDAASGVTRLLDIGVGSYLVATSIEAFIAQRLIRTICQRCKKSDTREIPEIKAKMFRDLGYDHMETVNFFRGEGCEECNYTGFKGRTAIFEILLMNNQIRDEVFRKSSSDAVKRLAIASGMKTLRQAGWLKVIEGVTTPEEIIKITPEDKDDEQGLITGELQKSKTGSSAPAGAADEQVDFKERRLFLRLDVKIPIHWKKCPLEKMNQQQSFQEFLAMTKNVSAGGILFVSKEPLLSGQILELKIDIPQESPITCLAKVIRIEEMERDRMYNVAVCFLDLSGADRARMNRFVVDKLSIAY